MQCVRPYMMGILPCRCGRCLPCLVDRRRVWTHRLMLESYGHEAACFVTVSYNESHYPSDGSLSRDHAKKFLKRLRKALAPRKIRFYLVGEYGEESGRPHYHALLFGVDRWTAGGLTGGGGVVQSSWIVGRSVRGGKSDNTSLGFSFVGDFNRKTAEYVAGYVTKKLTDKDDPRLQGREPEFSTMSMRPGIGSVSIPVIEKVVRAHGGIEGLGLKDVPTALRHEKKLLPLGRFLRGKLRQALSVTPDGTAPPEALRAYVQEELSRMRKEHEDRAKVLQVNAQKLRLDECSQILRNMRARLSLKRSKL